MNKVTIRVDMRMPDGEVFSVVSELSGETAWNPEARERAGEYVLKQILRETNMYMDGLKYAPSEITRMKEAMFP